MLTRCMRAAKLLNFNAPRAMRGFASAKKDYYEILGLNRDASIDEIKTAYRNLAKRYHPDVNAATDSYQGDAEKFKDVVEAYQVLSIQESRTAYDLQNQSAPDFIYRAQRMEQQRKYADRGKDGNPKKEAYPPESYAEMKRKFLAEERKKFNVNEFGRYNGGVPQKGKGVIRGSAMGNPGSYHDPFVHNMKVNPDPDSQFVTSADALAFKNYMNEDKYAIKRRGTWFQAKVDFDFFRFETYRIGWVKFVCKWSKVIKRWIRNVILLTFGLSFFSSVLIKARNRSILKQVESLGPEAHLTEGTKVGHQKVKQGSTGIIKLV